MAGFAVTSEGRIRKVAESGGKNVCSMWVYVLTSDKRQTWDNKKRKSDFTGLLCHRRIHCLTAHCLCLTSPHSQPLRGREVFLGSVAVSDYRGFFSSRMSPPGQEVRSVKGCRYLYFLFCCGYWLSDTPKQLRWKGSVVSEVVFLSLLSVVSGDRKLCVSEGPRC
jgi:hypothetical protein